ncbi:hypothetical protein GCM10022423_29430 [Flavobacterium ginsengiterrae]|uniref:MPN domain-containing protein n=1 Tax=Flavobacterium ginsengiterrae TaxID=871695 RepID=A0ABP7GQ92_9FLAO
MQQWYKNTIEFIEQFKVLPLSQSNEALGIYEVNSGGISSKVVDIRVLFAAALKATVGIILCHNHPSGTTVSPVADRQITSRVIQAGKLLDIQVMDHLIITPNPYHSFTDNGEMQ